LAPLVAAALLERGARGPPHLLEEGVLARDAPRLVREAHAEAGLIARRHVARDSTARRACAFLPRRPRRIRWISRPATGCSRRRAPCASASTSRDPWSAA